VLIFAPKPGAFVAPGGPWSLMRWRLRAKQFDLNKLALALGG
jgi:hypothetical protein